MAGFMAGLMAGSDWWRSGRRIGAAVIIALALLAAGWYSHALYTSEMALREDASFVRAACTDPDIEVAEQSETCQKYLEQ